MSDSVLVQVERPYREPVHRLEPPAARPVHAWRLQLYSASIGISTALNWDSYFDTIRAGDAWSDAMIHTLGGELLLPDLGHAYPWRAELRFESDEMRKGVLSLLTSAWGDGGTNLYQLSVNSAWSNYSANVTVGFMIHRGLNRISVIQKDATDNPTTIVLGRFLE